MLSGDIQLTRGSLPDSFKREVELLKNDFGLMKILFFSASGETVYSSDPSDIGHVIDEKFFYDVVAKGIIYKEFVKKNTRSVSGQLVNADVVETYMPVMRSGKFVGASVVYMDITRAKAKSDRLLVTAFSALFFLVCGLIGAVVMTSRGSRKSDIARRKAEEALKESENFLQTIIDTEPDCVKLLSRDGKLMRMNPAGLEMVEADSFEQVKGRPVYPLIVPEYRQAFQSLTERTFEGKPGKVEFEMVGLKGGRIWLATHAVPVRNERGEIIASLGITRNITERKRAEGLIKASLREKEILLKEIHHRVKNNLQIVASMLELQAGQIQDKEVRILFDESQRRIETMSLIHEKLYRARDLSKIDFKEYVEELAANLTALTGHKAEQIELETLIEGVFLDINSGIPCGLIINELVFNSLRHAFPNGRKGRLTIHMHEDDDGSITLSVRDNGVGLPEGLDFRNAPSLGLQLVISLVTQLNGIIEHDGSNGTAFKINFRRNNVREV
ncbi:MAG: PAS domain-containing protein [Nitrospiraceae bacterium]|nr:PAS domain-containing protein [Nitrospiraceae bacterium]